MNRVVVTGLGCISPLGNSVSKSWRNLCASIDGTVPFQNTRAGIVDLARPNDFTCGSYESLFDDRDLRRMSRFVQLAVLASYEALNDANLLGSKTTMTLNVDTERFGCVIGSGIGSVQDIDNAATKRALRPNSKVSPHFMPRILPNMAAGNVSIKFGLRGLSHCASTACASGNQAIGDAFNFIRLGMQDICLAGATEAPIHPLSIAGFASARSLSPLGISRPFDQHRNGFVLGEGSGMLVLESLDHARSRGASILAEIIGYGISSDAYHITSPSPDGDGARRAMEMALKMGNIEKKESPYVNAHATSTALGDLAECNAIDKVFRDYEDKINVSSNKGSMGHLLGAAGAVESIFTIMSLREGIIPHTLNLQEPLKLPDNTKISFVLHVPISQRELKFGLTNSLGFGGVNTSLLFKRWT